MATERKVKSDAAEAPKKATRARAKKTEEVKTEAVSETTAPKVIAGNAPLVRPHVSEKAAIASDRGTYVFDVPMSAEKVSIKKAVEALYGVKVLSVRTIRHAGKPVYRGKRVSARNAWKKAIVALKPGQKIDLYQGV